MGPNGRLHVGDLFERAGLDVLGPIAWGVAPTETRSGVYAISICDARISAGALPESLRQRWLDDQHIVYIGRAKVLRKRLQQFYRHTYGANSPHRGGQSILTLGVPLEVYWALAADYATAEDRLIEYFRTACGAMPFGNRIKSARLSSPTFKRPDPARGR